MIAPLWLRRGRTVYVVIGQRIERAIVCGPMGDDRMVWIRWSTGVAERYDSHLLHQKLPQLRKLVTMRKNMQQKKSGNQLDRDIRPGHSESWSQGM